MCATVATTSQYSLTSLCPGLTAGSNYGWLDESTEIDCGLWNRTGTLLGTTMIYVAAREFVRVLDIFTAAVARV
jgi:hypothetical protein